MRGARRRPGLFNLAPFAARWPGPLGAWVRTPLESLLALPDLNVPVSIWKSCVRVSVPSGSRHVPATLAGTMYSNAVHHWWQSVTSARSSGDQF